VSAFLKIFAISCAGILVWTAAASRVPDQTRLPLGDVVRGASVAQPFGCTTLVLEPLYPFCPSHHVHTGVDLAAPEGTAVHAATGGLARVGYDQHGAGLLVSIAFDSHVRILYCHLLRAAVVSGHPVGAGDVVGQVGSTGLSTGPHLHLEIQVDGRSVDPAQWLPPRTDVR
jgi:murein DD-endopeptidase MepM/ murein hydrolase activator NlpD